MAAKSKKKTDLQEDILIEQTYRDIAGAPKQPKQSKTVGKFFLFLLILLILLAGGFGGYKFFLEGVPFGQILENVTVAGVSVGGLTKEEAVSVIEESVAHSYSNESMTVTLVNHSADITPEIANVSLNVEEAVEIAYSYGRSGSYAKRKLDQFQAQTTGIIADVSSCFTIDQAAVRNELQKLAEHYDSELTQSTFEIVGQMPSLSESVVTDGDTQAGTAPQTTQELIIKKGTPKYNFSIDDIFHQVLEAYSSYKFHVEAQCEIILPDELDLEAIYKETAISPVDAVMDTETFEISEHSYGHDFDLATAQHVYSQTLYGQTSGVPFRIVEPQVKSQALRELLFRDVLSEYTAYTNSSWGRQTNLRLSCEAINGTVLMPGDIFSYNPALGERTAENGWQQAASYVGNKTISEYGGGICQASSCLYYCAMLADLEILERTNHGFISDYMPFGMDATVSWGGPEFRFKNNSDYPVKIEAIAEAGNVTVRLLGTDNKDYYVKMEYEVLNTYPYKTIEEEHAPDNKDGYKDGQVIITPYTGYKIKTYRCKYNKATDELISRTLEATSEYAKRDKVVCKIVDPAAATTPQETVPAGTQPVGISGTVTEDG